MNKERACIEQFLFHLPVKLARRKIISVNGSIPYSGTKITGASHKTTKK